MTEYKLFEGAVPYVSTAEFHADRERAPHLEQPVHQGRLNKAAEFIREAYWIGIKAWGEDFVPTLSDLGCGDGGLLQLVQHTSPELKAWGYDFQPSNRGGWEERGVTAEALDVFGIHQNRVQFGSITVCTEVLEHLADPHGAVKWIGLNSRFLIASSPWTETDQSHDECHAWAWDMDGYSRLMTRAGFEVIRHERVGMFQVMLAQSQPRIVWTPRA